MNWEKAITVQDILDEKRYTFTFHMIAVRVNGTLRRRQEFISAVVLDGSKVQAIHVISGG